MAVSKPPNRCHLSKEQRQREALTMNPLERPTIPGEVPTTNLQPHSRFNEGRTLIDDLLADQGQLTAVEQFARAHERHEIPTPRYRDLIPLSAPASGQQFAFEVDLDKCSGCKACVTACHSLNGLDDGEAWRDVGQLVSDDWRRPFQQTVTTACHHCVDPGCLNGCPVLAYEKDPVTGIVRHLDDQCIGCQYCILKCPYDVPKYSKSRGIVRKCDMCSQRLAVGEAPACVQACPNEAIRITVVRHEDIQVEFREGSSRHHQALAKMSNVRNPKSEISQRLLTSAATTRWLPGAPEPGITLPTTRYISKQPLALDLISADAAEARLQPAHWPLVWMLALTQLSAGAFALLPFLPLTTQTPLAVLGLVCAVLGLTASIMHLGKPLKAWRSFLGLRRSWLSREIVAFGLFTPLATVTTITLAMTPGHRWITSLVCATALTGLLGVFCSGMIYHDTRRAFWIGARSIGKFLGTMLVFGLAAARLIAESNGDSVTWLGAMLALVATMKLAGEHKMFRRAGTDLAEEIWPKHGNFDDWSLTRSAVLMRDRLGLVTRLRFFAGVTGGMLLPLISLLPATPSTGGLAAAGLLLCLFGEVTERYLFFRVVVPSRMPGTVLTTESCKSS